jgi:hypothetical protein
MRDGRVMTNPGYQNPDIVEPAGPVDPEVGLLVAVDESDAPIAVLANYALHYVGGPLELDTVVHADYFGAFDAAIQRMAGREFVGMMLNGACGDINNFDTSRPAPDYDHPFAAVERAGDRVAAAAYGAWRGIDEFRADATVSAVQRPLAMSHREVSPGDVEAARRRVADTTTEAEAATLADPEWLRAHVTLALSDMPTTRDTVIQGMRVGDLAVAALPAQAFVEIGLEIKERSPFARTLVAGLANDHVGYVATERAFAEGSYEIYNSPHVATAGTDMTEAMVNLLRDL